MTDENYYKFGLALLYPVRVPFWLVYKIIEMIGRGQSPWLDRE